MRVTRIVSGLLALVVAAALALATWSPAATGAAKPKHDLTANGKEIRETGKFAAYGKVTTHKGKRVILQRKLPGRGKPYRFFKDDRTSQSKGRFYIRFDGPVGSCYRIVVPGTRNYRVTRERIGCIVRE